MSPAQHKVCLTSFFNGFAVGGGPHEHVADAVAVYVAGPRDDGQFISWVFPAERVLRLVDARIHRPGTRLPGHDVDLAVVPPAVSAVLGADDQIVDPVPVDIPRGGDAAAESRLLQFTVEGCVGGGQRSIRGPGSRFTLIDDDRQQDEPSCRHAKE
jgi:hypothetical protein